MPIPKSGSPGVRAHSQTSRIEVSKAPAWLSSLASQLKDGRDVVLLVADEPGRQVLVDMLQPIAREVLVPSRLDDAEQLLQCRGAQIAAAVLSSQPEWGVKLRVSLATAYPEIRRVVLIS